MKEVVIAGVGLHKFGRFDNESYIDIGRGAIAAALKDANITWKEVQAAYCSAMYLPPTTGSRILTQLGMTGIPIADVEAACASGGVALRQAYMAIASGFYDVVLAFGVEKMPRGFMDPAAIYEKWQINMGLAVNPMYWAILARRHMEDYGTTAIQMAKVSVKNHKNAVHNPYAMYQKELSIEEVLNSRMVCDPLTLLMLCAPNEGAAAVVLCSKRAARKHARKSISIAASVLKTSLYPWFRAPAYSISSKIPPAPITTWAAKEAYEMANLGTEDLDFVELQDTDAFSEIMFSEQLGLCNEGEGGRMVDEGITEIAGKLPINPSGGLLSSGEPVGASHLRQVTEAVWQLRGEAGRRQVAGARVGLCHVIGAGGNCAVTILKK